MSNIVKVVITNLYWKALDMTGLFLCIILGLASSLKYYCEDGVISCNETSCMYEKLFVLSMIYIDKLYFAKSEICHNYSFCAKVPQYFIIPTQYRSSDTFSMTFQPDIRSLAIQESANDVFNVSCAKTD